jgi:hypothetical protein
VVSVNLMVEVLDNYHGPIVRKLWLVAFAEYANDETRAGWPSRHLLAQRLGVSESYASQIATALVSEGVIKRDGAGGRGRGATRYVLAPLPNGVSPGQTPSTGNRVLPRQTLYEDDGEVPW